MDMSWFGNSVLELGSLRWYFANVELGFDTLGEASCNLIAHWNSWERHVDSDGVEFGKVEGKFGRWERELDN